jgi:hypothetical protein
VTVLLHFAIHVQGQHQRYQGLDPASVPPHIRSRALPAGVLDPPGFCGCVWNRDYPRLGLSMYTYPSHVEQEHRGRLSQHNDLLVCQCRLLDRGRLNPFGSSYANPLQFEATPESETGTYAGVLSRYIVSWY